ncbi:MAG: helix-turn-helix transcriptional regulator [Sulfuricurvum sp.]|nr:helix-turn-helix transcriptional regulator [Sulfuricurvum sp.]
MKNRENIEAFYKNKFDWIPKGLKNEIGHFNVFLRGACGTSKNEPINYNRRDYFKITLLKGNVKINYAHKSIESKKYALMFSDPLVPYSWEPLNEEQSGYFCIFTEAFFHRFGALREYPMFQPNGDKVFLLDATGLTDIETIYEKMFTEIVSEYPYKYDVLRNHVFELIHYALKMEPISAVKSHRHERSTQIAFLFMELLERQFPIESPFRRLEIKTPSDFAKHLNIHVNHLNRTLKNITGKTTSELIAQRISQEAIILLKHTDWSISDIAFALGYDEAPHFINFFKKMVDQTPKKYRESIHV